MSMIHLPIAVCAAVNEILSGSHSSLEALFRSAGAPGPPPALAHHSKWKAWLYQLGNDPSVNSLQVLGRVIEEFMDLPPAASGPSLKEWNAKRDRLKRILANHGFHYSTGGIVRFNGSLSPEKIDLQDSKFWKARHFRLFISHLSADKEKITLLQRGLLPFGISSFVAHKDIEPTKEWLNEIEKALFTMDALAAVLTPNFKDSNWTDHEIGIAIGRDVLVIPIRNGLDPYGFIARFQGIPAAGKSVGDVARSVFKVLVSHPKSRDKMIDISIDRLMLSQDIQTTKTWLDRVGMIKALSQNNLTKLRDEGGQNRLILESADLLERLNKILCEYDIKPVKRNMEKPQEIEDDIPF